MRKFITTTVGILSLAFGLAACSESPKAADNANKMTNGDLERAVSASINGEPSLVTYKIDVSGDVDKNAVTLSGTVPTEALRSRAVELAKSGRPNLLVTDKIDVKPVEVERSAYTEDMAREARDKAKASGESVGDSLDDAWIHTKIRTKLVGQGELPGGSVNVDVKNNVVTLRGSVESKEQRAKVEEVAKSVDGVKSVKNMLVIKK
jgi:hyperosmotically inducible protein